VGEPQRRVPRATRGAGTTRRDLSESSASWARALIANIEEIRERDLEMSPTCPTGCLRKCTYKSEGERFCIVHALDRAQRGDTETGLVFCGSNAWKATRIETVAEIFEELFHDEVPLAKCG